jgi:DNA-binding NarL/FixJ family response regulator
MTNNDIQKYSYLIIDDDELARDVLSNTLNFIGATQLFFAEDAATAYRLAQQHRPDFILLDIYMPEVDGWALLDQLRQVAPQAAIVMVTGSHQQADFAQSMQQRVDGFCIKPVMPDVMRKSLINARRRKQSGRH